MVKLYETGMYYKNGEFLSRCDGEPSAAAKKTMAYKILSAHNTSGDDRKLKMKLDAMASHDITYVGIIQTARASGLSEFPLPYVLTNCHNSLCAVGGTINEDDHRFGLSAAEKYGGIYVPAHQAVIHAYMREEMSGCGKMILGSDSHTRYGALGTLAIGEGGPELVKQLLSRTYDIDYPRVVAVKLTGKVRPGVGPQDVALALIGATFKNGFVKNSVIEFIGDGIASLPIEFRNGIDVMTTETACLSSIWMTDGVTREYYKKHKREEAFKPLCPDEDAYYDAAIEIDLSSVRSMIALPHHPSNAYTVAEVIENAAEIFASVAPGLLSKIDADGNIRAEQGVIAGCAGGTFDNLCAAADILKNHSCGNGEFALSAYPASQPVYLELMKNGCAASLMEAGVSLRSAFCGPCFGAGDVPSDGALSLRHSTRNFPNREGSKPSDNQSAYVALCDARTIAASAVSGGVLTPADSYDAEYAKYEYHFDDTVYKNRVYNGYKKADPSKELKFGPNITDWPEQKPLSDKILLGIASVITDPVTTTDELIPSGETSSYRSNPVRLSSFALSRKDPGYVGRARDIVGKELPGKIAAALASLGESADSLEIGSAIYAVKPGDGSAREQAASCQRVLGGLANIAAEYATKRYRSNLINWGMLPFTFAGTPGTFSTGDYILIKGVKKALASGGALSAKLIKADGTASDITLALPELTGDEKQIILDGCLINYYKSGK